MQQFIVDANTLDYPVGSIYYSITSENLDGLDTKAVTLQWPLSSIEGFLRQLKEESGTSMRKEKC